MDIVIEIKKNITNNNWLFTTKNKIDNQIQFYLDKI